MSCRIMERELAWNRENSIPMAENDSKLLSDDDSHEDDDMVFDTILTSVPEYGTELQQMNRSADLLESLPPYTDENFSTQLYIDVSNMQDKLAALIRSTGEKVESVAQSQLSVLLKLNDKLSKTIQGHQTCQREKEVVETDHNILLAMLREDSREKKRRAALELRNMAREPSKCESILSGGGLPPLVYSFLDAIERGWSDLQDITAATVCNLAFTALPTLPLYANSFGSEADAVLQAIVHLRKQTMDRIDTQCVVAHALANMCYCAATGGMSESSTRNFKRDVLPTILGLCSYEMSRKSRTEDDAKSSPEGSGIGQEDERPYLNVETQCWAYVALTYIFEKHPWEDMTEYINDAIEIMHQGLNDSDEEVVCHGAHCTANLCSSMSTLKGDSEDMKDYGYFRGFVEAKIGSSGILQDLIRLATSVDSRTRRYIASALSSLSENRQLRRQIVEAGGLQALASLASLSIPSNVMWGEAVPSPSPIRRKDMRRKNRHKRSGSNKLSLTTDEAVLEEESEALGSLTLPPAELRGVQESPGSVATQLFVAISMELLAKEEFHGLEVRKMMVSTSAVHSLLTLICVSSPAVCCHALKALVYLSETLETHNTLVDNLDRLLRSIQNDLATSTCLAHILANLVNNYNPNADIRKWALLSSDDVLGAILSLAEDGIEANNNALESGRKIDLVEGQRLLHQAMRALGGYLEILYSRHGEGTAMEITAASTFSDSSTFAMGKLKRSVSAPVSTSSFRSTTTLPGRQSDPSTVTKNRGKDGLSRDEFLSLLDIVIPCLQSRYTELRCEGYRAVSELAKVPRHHNKIVSMAGRFLIAPPVTDSNDCIQPNDIMRYIERSLGYLGFDPSSDIQLCQFDAILFENWHHILKRIHVQDRVEETIKSLLEGMWHKKLDQEEVRDESINYSSGAEAMDNVQKSKSVELQPVSAFFSPTTAAAAIAHEAKRGSESLVEILFGASSSELSTRSRSRSSTRGMTAWNEYLNSNVAQDGSTPLPGLCKKTLAEFVGYYPSLLQQRLLLFSPDRGPLDDFPHSRCIVMPTHDYLTFRYADILQKTVERHYGLAEVWSILFTKTEFQGRFAHLFCEALYRLPSVHFLTFYNSPNNPKPRAGLQFVHLLSNLPPFIEWVNFDNALHPGDLQDMMIPLSRCGVSGIAIRNSNFSHQDMKPLFDILKHGYASARPNELNCPPRGHATVTRAPSSTSSPPPIMMMLPDGGLKNVTKLKAGDGIMMVTSDGVRTVEANSMAGSGGSSTPSFKVSSPPMRPRKKSDPSPISPFAARDRLVPEEAGFASLSTIPSLELEKRNSTLGQKNVLRWLDVSGNNLGDKGAAILIAILANNPSLVALDISRNNIGTGTAFAKALCGEGGLFDAIDSGLETLILSGNQLGARTCEVILKKLWLRACMSQGDDERGLLTLDLSLNAMQQKVHSQAINDLIMANGTLRDINFEACKLTKGCLKKMQTSIIKNTNLHFLRLDGNQNEMEGMERVYETMESNRFNWAAMFHQHDDQQQSDQTVPLNTIDALKKVNDSASAAVLNEAIGLPTATAVSTPEKSTPSVDMTIPFVLGVLFSAPLVYRDKVSGGLLPMSMLDFDLERMVVEQVIRTSGRKIELMFEYASTKTLRNMVTLGYRALHFSGHGSPDSLAFEDDRGGLHVVPVRQLKSLCAAGKKGVRFVFVSACFSQSAGEAFVKAGIPHVVCVSLNADLLDKAAQTFTHAFYLSLAVGDTVQDAFTIGVEAVKAAPRIADPIHEGNKFVLLPKDGNHDESIFQHAPTRVPKKSSLSRGRSAKQLTRTNSGSFGEMKMLPNVPDNFIGRNVDLYIVMGYVKERRIVTILGAAGMGKSALAIATSNYLDARQYFSDGVYYIRLDRLSNADQLESAIMESLGYDASKRRQLIVRLKKKQILLVLDKLNESLSQSKGFRFLIQTLLDQTRVHVLCTSATKIGLGGETCHLLGPLHLEDEGKLFECRSNFHCREWLLAQKMSKKLLGQTIHFKCEGNPKKILELARDVDESGLSAMAAMMNSEKPAALSDAVAQTTCSGDQPEEVIQSPTHDTSDFE